MKHHYLFTIIYFLIIASSCDAMEKDILTHHIFNHIQEIMTIGYPRCARLLTNNHAVIIDKDQDTYIVNLKTKISQQINSSYNKEDLSIPILQSNDNIISTYCGKTITIYDAHTNVQKWNKTEARLAHSLAWKPTQNTIFLCLYPENSKKANKIKKYNYATNDDEEIFIEDRQYKFITLHPTEEIMCLIDNHGNIYWHELNDTGSKHKKLPIRNDVKGGTGLSFSCHYNFDGSYLAAGYTNKIKIVDHNKKPNPLLYLTSPKGEFFEEILAQENETFHAITFHPNNTILAILCSYQLSTIPGCTHKNQYVRYYDVKTLQCIEKTIAFHSLYSHDLAFASDGFSIIITLEDKCITIPVTFAIKEKCLYALLSLNQCKDEYEQMLPKDITRYITYTLIKSMLHS